MSNIIPVPRVPISIRPATMSDIPFIDQLQKANAKMVGWMPTKQLEGKIKDGHVIVAVEPSPPPSPGVPGEGVRVGYCIGTDRYMKHDDIGIIYQMNVVPGHRRKLVGASLIKALFDRAAYGCRLYCCWCAQDIEANHFWESLGFIPLAFRSGSRGKQRTHIFWQRRVREGDVTTPYWFPSQTNAGAIREDRLVLPIPPGTHWSEVMPLILPATPVEPAALPEPRTATCRKSKPLALAPTGKRSLSRWSFVPPEPPKAEKPKREKRERIPRAKVKNDPAHIAAARELRDRYLEHLNGEQFNSGTALPSGKYEVTRALASTVESRIEAKVANAKRLAA